MDPLDFVTTKALIKELINRYDALVIVGTAQRTQKDDDLIVSLSGSYHEVLGLVEIARMAARVGDGPHGEEEENDTTD